VASYSLLIKPSATKELAAKPWPVGAEKLTGHELYRLRQGNYRVLCEIADPARTVTVFKIGHRQEVDR